MQPFLDYTQGPPRKNRIILREEVHGARRLLAHNNLL